MTECVYGLDHILLAMPTNGESLARQFYGELLRLTEIPKPPALVGRGGVWFQCGLLQVHLGVEPEFRPARKAHPAFLVRDLAHLIEELERAGYEIQYNPDPNPGFERAFTFDPFGNRVELLQANANSPVGPQ